MSEIIELGDISICITRKEIKNVHLTVHPPDGQVRMTVPLKLRVEVARAYAASKIDWIARHQEKIKNQRREPPRQYVSRESHYVWGHRYLLKVVERNIKPSVFIAHKQIVMTVRPGSDQEKRAAVFQEWQRSLLNELLPPLIAKWEKRLDVKVSTYFLQKMKTKWGSCNYRKGRIRLNSELVKKPKDLVEYVLVHEMAHLLEANHGPRFIAILDKHLPSWRESRKELNELPLGS